MIDKTAFPSDTADKVLVRMPDGMRDQLKAAAKASNRTMNAEIVARLQASFGSLQGSMRGFEMTGQMDSTEDAAWTPQQVKLMKEVATEAAKQVVAFQAESLQPVHFGGGSIVQGPAPNKSPSKKPA